MEGIDTSTSGGRLSSYDGSNSDGRDYKRACGVCWMADFSRFGDDHRAGYDRPTLLKPYDVR
jgi:hypothetical protein